MSHALERTNPIGEKFVGRCIKCGKNNLNSDAALKDCPADKLISDDDALLRLIDNQ